MEYRAKYNPKIVFPSFTLVVTRYILKRPAARLRWINIPNYCTKRAPVQNQPAVDWTMTTVDRRDEPEGTYSYVGGLTVIPMISNCCDPTPNADSRVLDGPSLTSVDDDTLSLVSSLDLSNQEDSQIPCSTK